MYNSNIHHFISQLHLNKVKGKGKNTVYPFKNLKKEKENHVWQIDGWRGETEWATDNHDLGGKHRMRNC